MAQGYQHYIDEWNEREKIAFRAVSIVNQLWLNRSVELLLFRRSLFNEGPIEILKHHRYAREISQRDVGIRDSINIMEALNKLPLRPSRIDLGRLMVEWLDDADHSDIEAFLRKRLDPFLTNGEVSMPKRDVVLYGFGRIGRLLARFLIDSQGRGNGLRLRAVVCRGPMDLVKRAQLLRRDSVHGSFKGNLTILEKENAILANGCFVPFIEANHPSQVDLSKYDIHDALVIDNTGVWRDRENLTRHLEGVGVSRVLLTAPGKGDIPNLVYGVNTYAFKDDERIFSAASCTTNAIVPVLKVLNDAYGIVHGHIETVHSYTNDQNLLDNFHSKPRRGRAAPINMVITSTGAASAVAKAIPELTGRISGNAVRVPTANVSLAILNLELENEASREQINDLLRQASLFGDLVSQIDHTRDEELVSTDMVGNRHPAVVDSLATIAEGKRIVLYVWYDNEYGYSVQVLRLARVIGEVEKPTYF